MVRPTPAHTFLSYLRALNSNILVTIQSMGANTLPNAFDVAIRAENCLIHAGKIASRPPMPIFLEIQPIAPLLEPPLVIVPPLPMLNYQVAAQANTIMLPNQEFQEFKNEMKTMFQGFGNKMTNIEKQVYQNTKPYQAPY